MTQKTTQLILASHGQLACALKGTAEMIIGPQLDVMCFSLAAGADVEEFKERIAIAVSTGQPVLILVDMTGGTPWNVALAASADKAWVRVVGGVNLPMLLEVAMARGTADVQQLAHIADEAGVQGIRTADVISRLQS